VIAGGTVSTTERGAAFEIWCYGPDDELPHRFAVDSNRAFGEVTVTVGGGCGGIPENPFGPGGSVRVTAGSSAAVSLDGITWRAKYLATKDTYSCGWCPLPAQPHP
jgi:hypothetical protein